MVEAVKLIKMKCPKCGYKWLPRINQPKRCPRCGKRLEYEE